MGICKFNKKKYSKKAIEQAIGVLSSTNFARKSKFSVL